MKETASGAFKTGTFERDAVDVTRRFPHGSRAFAALLLFCVLFSLFGCDPTPNADDASSKETTSVSEAETTSEATRGSEEEITSAAKGQNTTAKSAEEAMDTAFVHRAAEENSRGDYTYLTDPSIDGDPNAVVLVTPTPDRENTGDGVYDHNVGVWYEPQAQQWAIFNQDRAAVPAGTTFQVVVPGGPEKFVHRAEPGNTNENSTYLDDSLVNGKPDVILSVTQNWNPGGGSGTYNDHPVDVRYDAGRQRWAIYNTDDSAMPDGAAFNVAVSGAAPMTGNDAGDPGQAAKPGGESGSETITGTEPESAGDTKPEESAQTDGDSEGFPEYRDFYSEGDPKTPANLVSSDSSTGAIPVVKPFNFGRDPGGPEDKTLYLTIPKLGLEDIPVFDTVSEEKLRDGTVHIPATGYPWQEGANVFIAGHRVGYENTLSYYVFFRLDELEQGDEILLEDSAGGRYLYRVNKQVVVGPDSTDVMNPVEGESLVTLQTCTLPDYEERLIVQGELVEKDSTDA